jgi:hypothetical protein
VQQPVAQALRFGVREVAVEHEGLGPDVPAPPANPGALLQHPG